MKNWVQKNRSKVPKKSKIGQAFTYFENQYEYLIGYLKDGRFNPDNGFTERAIRKFAIGRNNWMFSDTEAGADASALLYSFVVSAKVNGVNPYKALVKIFTELPKAKKLEDFENLCPIYSLHQKLLFNKKARWTAYTLSAMILKCGWLRATIQIT